MRESTKQFKNWIENINPKYQSNHYQEFAKTSYEIKRIQENITRWARNRGIALRTSIWYSFSGDIFTLEVWVLDEKKKEEES